MMAQTKEVTNAAEIAAELQPREQKAILATKGGEDVGFWFRPGTARGVPSELKERHIVGHCLSPLGEQVRAVLASKGKRTAQ